jgi:hypothetical protein
MRMADASALDDIALRILSPSGRTYQAGPNISRQTALGPISRLPSAGPVRVSEVVSRFVFRETDINIALLPVGLISMLFDVELMSTQSNL